MLAKRSTSSGDRIVLTTIIVLLVGLALVRMVRALREHAKIEEALEHRATHDTLTGLPNRFVAEQRVGSASGSRRCSDSQVALLFLDVDRFKLVNDTIGHTLGDELLVAVAERLERTCRPGDLVARIGGDEFVSSSSGSARRPRRWTGRRADPGLLRRAVRRPRQRDLLVGQPRGLPGRRHGPGRGRRDHDPRRRHRDVPGEGRRPGRRRGLRRLDARPCARAARPRARPPQRIERDELHVHYQPIIAAPDRAGRRRRGAPAMVPPDPRPGTAGQVRPDRRGHRPHRRASASGCRRGVPRSSPTWRRTIPAAADLYVSVNLSARQLRDPNCSTASGRALAENDLPARALCLELTESLLMENPTSAAAPRRAPSSRRATLDRRLRHRLLVARLPPAVPARRA